MLKVYAQDNMLHGDWLLGEGEVSADGDSGSGFSLGDLGKYASKAGDLIKTGQSAINTVTGGGTKPAGVKVDTSDPYYRCNAMKDARSKAQCRYEVDRALALRAKATATKKTTGTSTFVVVAALAAIGGAAYWFLK